MPDLLAPYIDPSRLTIYKPEALITLGADWRELLTKEALNTTILGMALGQVAANRLVDRKTEVHIRNTSPITEPLVSELKKSGVTNISVDKVHHVTRSTQTTNPHIHFKDGNDDNKQTGLLIDSYFSPYQMNHWNPSPDYLSIADHDVVIRYRALQLQHEARLQTRINDIVTANEPAVLFVGQKTYFNQLRYSSALRPRGWKCIAISFDTANHLPKADFFDISITTDIYSLMMVLGKIDPIKPLLLHVQGWLFRYHQPLLLDAFCPSGVTQVTEFMDSNRFWIEHDDKQQARPHLLQTWGPEVFTHHERQLRCESYIVNHMPGALFPGDMGYCKELLDGGSCHSGHLVFCSYPLRSFFVPYKAVKAANVVHNTKLVFIGGVTPLGPRQPAELFHDSQMLTNARLLLEQGFKLDIFNNPLRACTDSYQQLYKPHYDLQNEFKGSYRFLLGDLPWELNKQIIDYHYGVMLYNLDGLLVGKNHFDYLIPTKFFQYMEAGLPVLVSECWTALSRLVEEYGIGVVICQNDLFNLAKRLEPVNYSTLRKNVIDAREKLSMDRQIVRLEKLYQQLIEAENSHQE